MLTQLIPSKTLILQLTYLPLLGAIVFYSLVFSRQKWAANYNFMLTCLLLPSISFVITKAISGNIALSLGMVGALSIVRFRHPVKSPFELSIYFLLVTIGISVNSSVSASVALTLLFVFLVSMQALLSSNPVNITLVPTGFTQISNEDIYLLEIQSTNELNEATLRKELISSDANLENSQYRYKFSFNDLADLNNFLDLVQKSNQISDVKISKLT